MKTFKLKFVAVSWDKRIPKLKLVKKGRTFIRNIIKLLYTGKNTNFNKSYLNLV